MCGCGSVGQISAIQKCGGGYSGEKRRGVLCCCCYSVNLYYHTTLVYIRGTNLLMFCIFGLFPRDTMHRVSIYHKSDTPLCVPKHWPCPKSKNNCASGFFFFFFVVVVVGHAFSRVLFFSLLVHYTGVTAIRGRQRVRLLFFFFCNSSSRSRGGIILLLVLVSNQAFFRELSLLFIVSFIGLEYTPEAAFVYSHKGHDG